MESLPSYKNPPVIETVISVQFKPLKAMNNVHLWEYWSGIRDEFPKTVDQEPLHSQVELFGDDVRSGPQIPQLFMRPHASRLQALSEDGHKMVQLQNGRFIFNWRKLEDGEYPRWSSTYAEFSKRFNAFSAYIQQQSLGELSLNQWEVTYVNHLLKGETWETMQDIPKILPGLVGHTSYMSGQFESLDYRMQYVLPNNTARLYIELKKATLLKNNDDVFVWKLTTRGPISEDQKYEQGLELGRNTIVEAFTELSSGEAHKLWNRKS